MPEFDFISLGFLTDAFMGKPIWMWLAFMAIVFTLLAFDLGFLHKDNHEISIKESFSLSAMYIAFGLMFGGWVWVSMGSQSGMEYLTGFVVEKTLALDNIFVIALIFTALNVPRLYQHRVLFWGILGAIVLRAVMISLGATLVSEFHWVLYIFALFLAITGFKLLISTKGVEALFKRSPVAQKAVTIGWLAVCGVMAAAIAVNASSHDAHHHMGSPIIIVLIFTLILLTAVLGMKIVYAPPEKDDHNLADSPALGWIQSHLRVTPDFHGQSFVVKLPAPETGKPALWITPLCVALIMIELADIVFAVDSVPAIFTITKDPYIVYTSNIFAILGLRALYFALSAMMERFVYLKYALSVVLIFIGSKMFISDLMGWDKFPPLASLVITLGVLGAGLFFSLKQTAPAAESPPTV